SDITEALKLNTDEDDIHELMLIVTDPTDTGMQQRGKQVLNPGRIYYTATSGIWQTVWIEAVDPRNHIVDITITPDINKGCAGFMINTEDNADVSILIRHQGRNVAEAAGRSGHEITAVVVQPELWSPENPSIYHTRIRISSDEQLIEEVESYFAFRKIEVRTDPSGREKIYLNGQPVFLHAPLDQGYWPESGMTPPSDDAMIFDIRKTKELGFNCSRKHIKIEPRRWYYHADLLGLMVMQDAVSGGKNAMSRMGINLIIGFDGGHRSDTSPGAYTRAGRINTINRLEYEKDLEGMIKHLRNHPSIIMWIPFNEAWGQFDSVRIADAVQKLDPTRLIDPVSGWYDQGSGDFRSRHTYSIKLKTPPKKDQRVYFISEYGGYNLLVDGHLWDDQKIFGYKTESSRESLREGYTNLIRRQLIPLIKKGLGAAVYTQLTDVEIESNGFFTYDRKVQKIPAETVKALNDEIYSEFNRISGSSD
ncbi:MAG TPA: glycoside hydrolase family 2, partial [Spirochaeta sp.]|nr:glycoside hydrolase family 2 [Spirochaeta sp.]